jgi:hypothetical protein
MSIRKTIIYLFYCNGRKYLIYGEYYIVQVEGATQLSNVTSEKNQAFLGKKRRVSGLLYI